MDADGSGAIDAEELHEVFMVMGIKAPKAKVQEVLESHRNTAHGLGLSSSSAHSAAGPPSTSASADDVMEVEFPEFVEVVTSQLSKAKEERRRKDKETPLPYALLATAYRRKKVMEGLMYDKGGMRSRLLRAKGLASADKRAAKATKQGVIDFLKASPQNKLIEDHPEILNES